MGTIKNTTKGNVFFFDADDPRLVVITDPSHRLYDRRVEMPLDESMIESISDPKIGIVQSVIVRKVGENYEVVDGRQRVRCAREAVQRNPSFTIKIPCVTRTIKEFEAARIATVTNVQRTEDTPVVKGENAKRQIEMGATHEDLESDFGVGRQTISQWIKIAESPDVIKDAVDSGKISIAKALKIASKPPSEHEDLIHASISKTRKKPGRKPKGCKVVNIKAEFDASALVWDIDISNHTSGDIVSIITVLDEMINKGSTQ